MTKSRLRNSSNKEKREWFRVILQLRSSVIPAIIPRVIFCGVFGFFISIVHHFGIDVFVEMHSSIVPSIVLGLLLVFRTNTAYARFWEGRQMWGTLVNTVRNLARTIWVTVEENQPKDRQEKIANLRLLVAFAVATKLHLRSEPVNSELEALMPREWYEKLKEMNNSPLEVAFWIGDYLQQQYERNCINAYQLTAMFKLLDTMVDVLGACERISKTPIPLAYSIHLKQLLLIYSLTLPFQLVVDFGFWTAPIVCLISFAVFGIEEIGIEIENPFGCDPNDLPLDKICTTMQINIEDLITQAPHVRHWKTTPMN
ncbi:MAG: bestrophin family protein [Xenococcaceae cyanobacterium]